MRGTLLFLFTLLLCTGCREDVERLTVDSRQTDPPITSSGDCTILGRVIDEEGNGISGARVSVNFNQQATTDANGNYRLTNISVTDLGTTLYISADDYFEEWRYCVPEGGSLITLDIVLNSTIPQGTINAATGGTFELSNGARLSVPAGATRSFGQPYDGNINVALTFDDPTSVTAMEQSSGNVLATRGNFENREVLASLGMINLRVTDDNGRRLSFSQDQPAELFFPVEADFTTSPNDTVRFWQLQESLWIASGLLSFQRSGFVAPIFGGGLYNCDVPFPRATLCARLVNSNGQPLINQLFSISFNFGPSVFTFRTDNRGRFCASVARDQTLDLLIPPICPGDDPIVFPVGPFPEGETDLGDLTVDLPFTFTPLHVENCNGDNFSAADGLVWESGFGLGLFHLTDGTGNGLLTSVNCATPTTTEVQAVAFNRRATSEVISYTTGDLTPIDLTVCSDLNPDESANITLDGNPIPPFQEGSYLLLQPAPQEQAHRFWVQSSTPTDTLEFFITVPSITPGTYTGDEVNVAGFRYNDLSTNGFACGSSCNTVSVTIETVDSHPEGSLITLSFAATLDEVNPDTGETITADRAFTGSLEIIR